MLLRRLGYDAVLVAANGAEALDMLEREAKRGSTHEIQCILMDASMVRQWGREENTAYA
jgi:CheY-like chemotaxis protein